jgi:hypothetical protein
MALRPIFCMTSTGVCSTNLVFSVGLDAAGKTTILYKLKLGEIVTTIPTIGEFRGRKLPREVDVYSTQTRVKRPFFSVKFDRFQRRDGRIQEHLLHRVGRGRPGQNPSALEALLPEHPGSHFRD